MMLQASIQQNTTEVFQSGKCNAIYCSSDHQALG